jgi:hypothetical protein
MDAKEYGLADEEQADLHFALGKAYDDLGEYAEAIRRFDDGNRLKRRTIEPYPAAGHAATVDRCHIRRSLSYSLKIGGGGSGNASLNIKGEAALHGANDVWVACINCGRSKCQIECRRNDFCFVRRRPLKRRLSRI